MTDPALIERITRSLAFMLRHQPEKFDLELDSHGFADVGDVVQALNERLGEPVEEGDLLEAVRSGDRPRYEIQENRIRALYGHSIPVEPGPSSRPPDVLYVAVPEGEVERARRFGLRGGRRRFLHLAKTREDARESGRRAARDYTVLLVRALDAWEEGISFYDRQALWLAEEIPTHLIDIEETFHDGTEPESRSRESHWERAPRERARAQGRERGGRGYRGERGERGEGEAVLGADEAQRGEGQASGGPDGPRDAQEGRGRRRRRGRRGRDRERVEGDERAGERGPGPEPRDRARERDAGPRGRIHERMPRDLPPAPPVRERPASPSSVRPVREQAPVSGPARPFGAGLDPQEEKTSKPRSPATPPADERPREDEGGSGFGAGL